MGLPTRHGPEPFLLVASGQERGGDGPVWWEQEPTVGVVMFDIPRVQSRIWDPPSVQPGKGPSSSCTIRLLPLPGGADLLIPSRKRSLAAVPWIGLRNSVIGKAVKADHSYIAGFLPEKPNGAECSPSRAQSCAINPELALGLIPCLLARYWHLQYRADLQISRTQSDH